MATNYTGNVTPSLSNAPASSWTDDAAKRSHVGNTYLVTGSGGTAGNVYAFEEYAAPLIKQASGLPAGIVTITDGGEDLPMTKAEVSLSPKQDGTPSIESGVNNAPYLFRPTGATAECNYETNKVVGGTIAWNQLIQNGNFANGTTGWSGASASLAVTDGVAKVTFTGSAWNNDLRQNSAPVIANHVYLFHSFNRASSAMNLAYRGLSGQNALRQISVTTSWGEFGSMFKPTTVTQNGLGITLNGNGSSLSGEWFETKNFNIFDLTQMFGSTIADYIYALETANAGAGVAWFRKLFPKPYYAYNAGELMSVQTSAHKMVGFNALDIANADLAQGTFDNRNPGNVNNVTAHGYTPVVGGATYNFHSFVPTGGGRYIRYYDSDKNQIGRESIYNGRTDNQITPPAEARYIRLMWFASNGLTVSDVMNADICLNLSWDGERDGEYEEYKQWVYPLDSDLTLRGIPKLSSGNDLYYDGDTYESDGTVTRKYGIRAYQSGDETDGATMITDGTNTVYSLTTPTTESADPFTSPQVADKWGTEEYVDSRTVPIPVGHVTQYGMQYAITGHTGATLNVTGKNLLDPSKKTEDTTVRKTWYGDDGFLMRAGITYTLKEFHIGEEVVTMYIQNLDGDTIVSASTNVSYTPSADELVRFRAYRSPAIPSNMDVMLVVGSAPASFVPYNPSSAQYTSSFGQTVYGGTFDFVSGKLVVKRKIITLDGSQSIGASNNNRFYVNIPEAFVVNVSNQLTYKGVMSEMLPSKTWADTVYQDGCAPVYGAGIAFKSELYTTAQEWTTYFTNNPTVFSYELATPIEIDLDPTEVQTLLGLNNVWVSDGQISALTYQSNQFIPKYDWFETWNMPKITRNNGSVIVLPYPKEYTPEIHDVDAATTGRNAAGTMIRDRVATKHKFNYVFPPLSQTDATELLAATKDASFTLTTASPETGAKTNYRVYAGDKSLPVYWMPNHDTASWLYSSVSVNLIEM